MWWIKIASVEVKAKGGRRLLAASHHNLLFYLLGLYYSLLRWRLCFRVGDNNIRSGEFLVCISFLIEAKLQGCVLMFFN